MEPVVQWVGGKKRLLDTLKFIMPKMYNNYHEIFLGGGALLFNLQPKKSYSIEKNKNIYMIYKNIELYSEKIIEWLQELETRYLALDFDDRKEMYYEKRTEYNELDYLNEKDSITKTVTLLFLNKTCFNAVYRENSKGIFNVPFGNGKDCKICNEDRIVRLSKFLQNKNTKIFNEDFEYCKTYVKPGDLVYIDPPYYPLKNSSFTSYTAGGFNQECHDRLIELIKYFNEKKVYIILSNSNNDYFKQKLSELNVFEVSISRTLNSKKDNREKSKCEMIMTNFSINKTIDIQLETKEIFDQIEIGMPIETMVKGKKMYFTCNEVIIGVVDKKIQNLLLDNTLNKKIYNKVENGASLNITIQITN